MDVFLFRRSMNLARHHIIMVGTFHWFQICINVIVLVVNEALSIEEVDCCTVIFSFVHACLFTKLNCVRIFDLLSSIVHAVRLQFEDTYAFCKRNKNNASISISALQWQIICSFKYSIGSFLSVLIFLGNVAHCKLFSTTTKTKTKRSMERELPMEYFKLQIT